MHPKPLAYHLIWTTYGTWLPGDARGWRHRGDPEPRPPAPALEAWVREQLRFPPLHLEPEQRGVAMAALDASCARRGWPVFARVARPTHVHIVVTPTIDGAQARIQLKGDVTRALVDAWPALAARKLWTKRGWVVDLRESCDIEGAVEYVHDDHHGARR